MTTPSTNSQPAAPMDVNSTIAGLYPAEFAGELVKLNVFEPETASEVEREIAAALVMKRHAAELVQLGVGMTLRNAGLAINEQELDADYVNKLHGRDLDNVKLLNFAAQQYPDLTPTQALKRWQREAADVQKRGRTLREREAQGDGNDSWLDHSNRG